MTIDHFRDCPSCSTSYVVLAAGRSLGGSASKQPHSLAHLLTCSLAHLLICSPACPTPTTATGVSVRREETNPSRGVSCLCRGPVRSVPGIRAHVQVRERRHIPDLHRHARFLDRTRIRHVWNEHTGVPQHRAADRLGPERQGCMRQRDRETETDPFTCNCSNCSFFSPACKTSDSPCSGRCSCPPGCPASPLDPTRSRSSCAE